MHCSDAFKMMSEQLDRPLTLAEQDELDAHLKTCASCQQTAALLLQLDSLYSHVKPVQPPPDLTHKVLARLHRRLVWRNALRGGAWIMCISLVVIFGLGAVVLAISPLLDSAAQVPFVAGVIRSAEGIASVLQACLYAVRMILQASARSGILFIVAGYVMLAVGLVIWWTRALLKPQSTSRNMPGEQEKVHKEQ